MLSGSDKEGSLDPAKEAYDMTFSPKTVFPSLQRGTKDLMTTNYDLSDNDLDKTHSAKAIEYLWWV